jgi:glucose uptake protein
MILPETYLTAVLVMILGIVCWGSWTNTFKLAGKWRFELYYFDFALGLLAASLLLAYTLGSMGFDGFSFSDDLMHAGKRQWMFGFLGGVIFNVANMLLMAAIALTGMAVAFPISFGAALLVLVTLDYLIKPFGSPVLLFGGCALVVGAIVVDAMAYGMLNRQRHEALAKAGKARSLRRPGSVKGVVVSIISGLILGSFCPLVAKAQEGEIGLGPYSTAFVFAIGALITTFVFNLFFMNLPLEGEPVEMREYFMGTRTQHLWGILGGALWCVGAVATFIGASSVPAMNFGPSSYVMAQGSALVSALWGLLVWREFKGAELKMKLLLAVTLVLFGCGLSLVCLAFFSGVN